MWEQKRTKQREFEWTTAFEREVRRVPVAIRPDLLAWLRSWRRRPRRIFWVMDGVGRWRLHS
jgi:hypothetical protein